ncbi:MAG TPA: protein kinase [Gemmataceae bacterium]|nr:protein kinase [Gemmataceae bacterium]
MADAVTHPTTQELTAFGLGKLPERAAAAVAAHLDSCSACRQAVAGVSAASCLDTVRAAERKDASIPPNLNQPPNAPTSANRPAAPIIPCPNCPPELARHPKYLILRELGRGGMGVVYQARHKDMNRQVAIKVISRSLLDRPSALERFRREVQAAAQLCHRNIVIAYDAEQAGELHMLVMEFVPGQSLAEVVEKRGPLPLKHACYYIRQTAKGLQHAYERGMVHRDIKPSNLILTPQGRVKILDFGLAKMVTESELDQGVTGTDTCVGTAEYVAPEQAKDARTADIRADLYSLGCTLYCLLAGRPPFREDTRMNTILAHIHKEPQPLPELRPEVPERLWRVVARLLAKDPTQRYQKPSDVVAALAPFVEQGTKPDSKGDLAPSSVMSSAAEGTAFAADTNEIKKILLEAPGNTPPHAVLAQDEAASPFANLIDKNDASKRIMRVSKASKPYQSPWWKRPVVLATVVSVFLALILAVLTIDKGKEPLTKGDKSDPIFAKAFVVLEIDQPGAKVLIEGQRDPIVILDGKKEIELTPGIYRLWTRKNGFEDDTRPIELNPGANRPIKIKLKPKPTLVPNPPKELTNDPATSPKPSKPQSPGEPSYEKNNIAGNNSRPKEKPRKEEDAESLIKRGDDFLVKNDVEGAIDAYSRAIRLKADNPFAHCSLSVAYFKKGDVNRAISESQRAIELNATYLVAHTNLAKFLEAKGDLEGAISEYCQAIRLDPKLVSDRAHQGPSMQRLVGALGGVLNGKAPPAQPSERLLLAELCRVEKGRYRLAARLAAGAFKDKPSLAKDLTSEYRYYAACAAAQAGCGLGEDAGKLDKKERALWRKQALEWLRSDFQHHRKQLSGADAKTIHQVLQKLDRWQSNADLDCVRDEKALSELPEAERREWRKLWEEVTVDVLRQVLKRQDSAVQEMSAARLAELGSRAQPAVHDLTETLANPENSIKLRNLAALAIGRIGAAAQSAVPTLAKMLNSNEPLEVRQSVAESLVKIKYPLNEAALPAIIKAIEKDQDDRVRQFCTVALSAVNPVEKFRKLGADKALTKLLSEKGDESSNLRFDVARTLAYVLRDKAPDKTVEVLLRFLDNDKIKVYRGTDIKLSDGRPVPQPNLGDDARFMAAEALGMLGNKAARRPEVVAALRKAAKSEDRKLKEAARKAQKDLNIKD